jgi:hypothetical protein
MNKKIKVIDLINKKYHNLELPKHIRINKLEYFYNENRKTYDSEYGEQMSFDFTDNVLNMEVEILEDNTEEIEELKKEQEAIANPKTMMQEIRFYYDSNKMGDKINEIIRYIKRKDKSNDN